MDRIQLRRDSSARWAEINPILLEGEVGFEIDTKLRKIGDGVNRWNDLEYLRAEGISQETGNSQNITMSQDAITRELSELGSKIGAIIPINIKYHEGYIAVDGSFKGSDREYETPTTGYFTTQYIPTIEGETYKVTYSGSSSVMAIASFYNVGTAIESSITQFGNGNLNTKYIIIPSEVNYIRVCGNGHIGFPTVEKVEKGLKGEIDDIKNKNNEQDEKIEGITDDVAALKAKIGERTDISIEYHSGFVKYSDGSFSGSDAIYNPPTSGYFTSQYIAVNEGDICDIEYSGSSSVMTVACYTQIGENAITTDATRKGNDNYNKETIIIPSGVNYIRVCGNTHIGLPVVSILSDSIIKDTEHLAKENEKLRKAIEVNSKAIEVNSKAIYCGTQRRPMVSLTIDASSFSSSSVPGVRRVVELLNSHGFPCTIAPKWDLIEDNLSELKEYEEKGNSICVHSSTSLSNQVTEEVALSTIKSAHDTLVNNGFKPSLLVVYQGALHSEYESIGLRYFDFLAGKANRSANYRGDEPCITLSGTTDSPQKLWRYSAQMNQDSTVESCKQTIDDVIASGGNKTLMLYMHVVGNVVTLDQIEELLQYIDTKVADGLIDFVGADKQLYNFYTMRWSDVFGNN